MTTTPSDEVVAANRLASSLRRPDKPCKVQRMLDELPDEERKVVVTALNDPTDRYPSQRIASALSKRLYRISSQTVIAHREKRCCCID